MGITTSFSATREPETERMVDADPSNGYYFNGHYIPEEVLTTILSHVPAKHLLRCSRVCKNWNQIVKSSQVWIEKYKRKYKTKPKHIPWYNYYALFGLDMFNNNLLRNTNGQQKFMHWNMISSGGDDFKIEAVPQGCEALPSNVGDFNGHKSCFATSYGMCHKGQSIKISPAMCRILNETKPHIYVSEWVCGRFDCGCVYGLNVKFICKGHTDFHEKEYKIKERFEAFSDPKWKKVELTITEYPQDLKEIHFEHMGKDTQYWKGHYGSKMAGGVVKFLFDTIES